MKRLMTTLATAVAFAGLSLSAQAATVKTTTTTVKPVTTAVTTTTTTQKVTTKKAGKAVKHSHKAMAKKAHHKGKTVHHKARKGGVAKSKEVNMDIPADIKINQSSSVTGTAAPVAPMVQPTAPSTVIIAPTPVMAPAVVTPAVVVR